MGGIGGYKTTVAGAVSLTTGVVEITNISLPEITVTDIDVTSFDSPSNYGEHIAGAKDPGVIEMEVNYEKDSLDAMVAAIGLDNEEWTITLPDNSKYVVDGHIAKAFGGSTDNTTKIPGVLSIQCSSIPVFTEAPDAPVITGVVDDGNQDSVTVSVTTSVGSNTIQLYYKESTESTWITGLTRVGSGDIVQTGLADSILYNFYCTAKDPAESAPSNIVSITLAA
jgi:hypothetical protein